MTKQDLIREVARGRRMSQRQAGAVVNAMLRSIERALSDGEDVRLRSFGSFRVERRAPRRLKVPATGAWVEVPARLAPVFRGATRLNRKIATGAGKTPQGRSIGVDQRG